MIDPSQVLNYCPRSNVRPSMVVRSMPGCSEKWTCHSSTLSQRCEIYGITAKTVRDKTKQNNTNIYLSEAMWVDMEIFFSSSMFWKSGAGFFVMNINSNDAVYFPFSFNLMNFEYMTSRMEMNLVSWLRWWNSCCCLIIMHLIHVYVVW